MSLLDKASLIQIPSGYKATKLYSVIPDTGAGDFTFARSSSGTRVNSDGLIETAQVLGSEEITAFTNGTTYPFTTFATSGNNITSAIVSSAFAGVVSNSISLISGEVYKVSFDYVKNSGDDLRVVFSNSVSGAGGQFSNVELVSASGSYDLYLTVHTTISNAYLQMGTGSSSHSLNIAINNVSVKEVFENDVPRLDYSGGATCASLLLEPQRTNILNQSNSNFVVNASSSTIDYNNATSPEGITNAYKSTATGAYGSFVRSLNIAFTDPSAFSVFLKYGNNQWVQIINAGSSNHYVNVDIQNGVFGTNGSDTSDLLIEDYGNGWYRVSGKFSGFSGTSTLRVYMGSNSSAGWAGASAIVGNYYYGYGFQVESNASYATSYIPTSGSTVTRTADVCSNAGNLATFNDSEGVLFAEIAALEDDLTSRVISLNDGSTNNRVIILYQTITNSIRVIVSSGGSIQFDSSTQNYDITDVNKIALKYKENDFALWINGTEVSTDTSGLTPIGLNNLEFNNANGTSNFYGKCKQLIYFNEALTDTELAALTTI